MRKLMLAALALATACTSNTEPPLVANDVEVTRTIPGMTMSAVYLSLTNKSDKLIRINRVSSPQYESVQLHETTIDEGVARMRAMDEVEIPAGATVTFQRGGKHLMLMRPTGSVETVSLSFHSGDDLVLTVAARPESLSD